MDSNLDNEQLYNICSGLFKGFIDWIDVNSQNEKALILDSAYQFKNQILSQDNPTLHKKIKKNHLLIINYNIDLVFCNCIEWVWYIANSKIFTIFDSL